MYKRQDIQKERQTHLHVQKKNKQIQQITMEQIITIIIIAIMEIIIVMITTTAMIITMIAIQIIDVYKRQLLDLTFSLNQAALFY